MGNIQLFGYDNDSGLQVSRNKLASDEWISKCCGEISYKIGSDWFRWGRHLGLSDSDLDNIKYDNNKCFEKADNVLQIYKHRNGNLSWEQLKRELEAFKRFDIVLEIERQFGDYLFSQENMSNKTVDLSQEPRKDFKKENQQPDLNGSKQESTVVDKKSIQEKQPPISNSDGQKSTVEDKISIQENQQPDLNGSEQESTVVDKKVIQDKQQPISNSDSQKSTVEDKISIQENQFSLSRDNGVFHSNVKDMLNMDAINIKSIDYNNLIKNGVFAECAFGKVTLYTDKNTGKKLAIKCIKVGNTKANKEAKEALEKFKSEISLFQALYHKRIVEYYDAIYKDTSISLVMEYMEGGSLHDKISNDGALDEKTASKMSYQILDSLSYLHSKKIIHRDLKCANILLDLNGNCKIADFGISKKIETIRSQAGCNSYTGTYHWMAPEVLRQVKYGNKADIWSFGCTVFAMLMKNLPWSHLEGVIAAIEIATNPTIPDLPDSLSKSCQIFINDCFNSDPAFRPSALTLLTYDWIKIYSS